MTRTPILVAGWLFALSCPAPAEVIDRIAVSVGNRVITSADLDREMRVTAFLQGVPLALTADARRTTAHRMVEQKLISRELETARYPVPSSDVIEPAIADFKKRTFGSEDEFRAALDKAGITEQDLRDAVLWQRTLLTFIAVRFEPGVQVTAQEVQDYFDKVVAPIARDAHPDQDVTLEDYRQQIVEKLTGERANVEMLKWLDEARKRNDIVYHEEAFQ